MSNMESSTWRRGGKLWAWGIVLAFVLFAGSTISFVVLAFNQRTDLVRADYYEQDQLYDRHIERVNKGRQPEWRIRRSLQREQQALVLDFPAIAGRDIQGTLLLYRPSDASLDRRIALAADDRGRQRIDLNGLAAGRWKAQIEWRSAEREMFVEYSFDWRSEP